MPSGRSSGDMVIHFPDPVAVASHNAGGGGFQPPAYYDFWYSNKVKWYECDPEDSNYIPLWKKMLGLSKGRIIDIGCGPGQVCQLANRMGIPYHAGIDSSPVAIEKARERCPDNIFFCDDAMDVFPSTSKDSYDTVFICETLEHMKDDLGFINMIPKGKKVVASIPTFGAGGHVFFVDNYDDVRKRYADIKIEEIGTIYQWIWFSGVKI